MSLAGGVIIYYMRDSGITGLVLVGSELFLLILGAVMGLIPVIVIILIIIIGAGVAAFYAHKIITGNAGG
jgi:hypothetical protein